MELSIQPHIKGCLTVKVSILGKNKAVLNDANTFTMKFTLHTVTKYSGRLGILGGLERLPNVKLQTPAMICHTKGGSIPHLSKEAIQYLSPDSSSFLQVSISNTLHMHDAVRASRSSLAEFIAQKDSATILLLRDPSEAPIAGVPERESIPIFTRCGRRNIHVKEYMSIVESFRPDAYVTLYDGDTDAASSKKREQKSVDRTEKFIEQTLQWHRKSDVLRSTSIIAPVVGGYNLQLREKSVKFLQASDSEFDGYLIDGLHMYGPSVAVMESPGPLRIVTSVCEQLPEQKARFCFGAYDPRLVLEMIMAGVDVFDSSYVYLKAAQEYRALVFSYDVTASVELRTTELDTTDARYEEDFEPLLPGCICFTCQKYSRAYLHHLYNTREMVGPILLMIHNMHHYMEFFKTIRHHVAHDTLPKLLEHLSLHKYLPPYEPKKGKNKPSSAMQKESVHLVNEHEQNKKQRG